MSPEAGPDQSTPFDRMAAEIEILPWISLIDCGLKLPATDLVARMEQLKDEYLEGKMTADAYAVARTGTLRVGQGRLWLFVGVKADQTFYYWHGQMAAALPEALAPGFSAECVADPDEMLFTLRFEFIGREDLDLFCETAREELLKIPV